MSYRSAQQILPQELIELIQQYVDGDFLYIPRKNARRKWGENTSTREELRVRDALIYENYLSGMPMAELAEKYFLSEKSIQRIVYRQRKEERDEGMRTF